MEKEGKRARVELVCADGVRVTVEPETIKKLTTLRDMLADLGPQDDKETGVEEVPLPNIEGHVLRRMLCDVEPATAEDGLANSVEETARLLASADHLGAQHEVKAIYLERIARTVVGSVVRTGGEDARWPEKDDFVSWEVLPTVDAPLKYFSGIGKAGYIVSPDGTRAILNCEGELRMVDLSSPVPAFSLGLECGNGDCLRVLFSDDSARLFFVTPFELRVWNTRSVTLAWKAQHRDGGERYTSGFMFAKTSSWVAVASSKVLRIWDVSTGTLLCSYSAEVPALPRCLEFSPDGSRCVLCDPKGILSIIDTASGKLTKRKSPLFEENVRVDEMAVSNRSVVLSHGEFDKRVAIIDLNSDDNSRTHHHGLSASKIAVSPDGRTLALAVNSYGWQVHMWQIEPVWKSMSKSTIPGMLEMLIFGTDTALRVVMESCVLVLRRLQPNSVLVGPATKRIVESMMQLYETLHARVPLLSMGVWLEVIEKLLELY